MGVRFALAQLIFPYSCIEMSDMWRNIIFKHFFFLSLCQLVCLDFGMYKSRMVLLESSFWGKTSLYFLNWLKKKRKNQKKSKNKQTNRYIDGDRLNGSSYNKLKFEAKMSMHLSDKF